jgi:hypothetical protein
LKDQCVGLRTVDLTVWAEDGGLVPNPLPTTQDMGVNSADEVVEEENANSKAVNTVNDGKLWREWEWTRALLKVEPLRHVKVTWWGFATTKEREARFDSWLGRRMAADKQVRDRMVLEGRIVEGVVIVPGNYYSKAIET